LVQKKKSGREIERKREKEREKESESTKSALASVATSPANSGGCKTRVEAISGRGWRGPRGKKLWGTTKGWVLASLSSRPGSFSVPTARRV